MNKTPMKASDPNDLERHILDPNIAKSEAEWWAKGRIEELERGIDAAIESNNDQQRQIEELEQWKFTAEGLLREGRYQELCAELTALQADNVRLREALENVEGMLDELRDYPITHDMIIEALAATEPKP